MGLLRLPACAYADAECACRVVRQGVTIQSSVVQGVVAAAALAVALLPLDRSICSTDFRKFM